MVAAVFALAVPVVAKDQLAGDRQVLVIDPALLHVDHPDAPLLDRRLLPDPAGVEADRRPIQVVLNEGEGVLGLRIGDRQLAVGEVHLGQLVELPHQPPDRLPVAGRPAVDPRLALLDLRHQRLIADVDRPVGVQTVARRQRGVGRHPLEIERRQPDPLPLALELVSAHRPDGGPWHASLQSAPAICPGSTGLP